MHLGLWWSSKGSVVGSPRDGFSPVEQTRSSVRQLLISVKIWAALSHIQGYLAMLAIVVHRDHSWLGLLMDLFSWSLNSPFQWNLDLRKEALRSDPAQIFQVLGVKNVVSTAIGTKRQPLGCTQWQQHSLYYFGSLLENLTNNLKMGFSWLVLWFLLNSLTLEGRILSTQVA